MVPILFNLGRLVPAADAFPPSFVTPLGRVEVRLEAGGVALPPTAAFAAGERTAVVWSAPARVEMVLTEPRVSLPPGMAVAGAIAVAWRIDATRPAGLTIKCTWTGGASRADVGPESGENLDARSWTDGRTKVTIGLPDYGGATTYSSDGFEVAVGRVDPARQGHFVCAWGPDSPGDPSTWFAVDRLPSQVLPTGI